jgi:hypothetical protein
LYDCNQSTRKAIGSFFALCPTYDASSDAGASFVLHDLIRCSWQIAEELSRSMMLRKLGNQRATLIRFTTSLGHRVGEFSASRITSLFEERYLCQSFAELDVSKEETPQRPLTRLAGRSFNHRQIGATDFRAQPASLCGGSKADSSAQRIIVGYGSNDRLALESVAFSYGNQLHRFVRDERESVQFHSKVNKS